MTRSNNSSGVKTKASAFQPKEASVKLLHHQAGDIIGYEKPLPPRPEPRLEPIPKPPHTERPEPSERKAGERFGRHQLPDSIKEMYATRPLGSFAPAPIVVLSGEGDCELAGGEPEKEGKPSPLDEPATAAPRAEPAIDENASVQAATEDDAAREPELRSTSVASEAAANSDAPEQMGRATVPDSDADEHRQVASVGDFALPVRGGVDWLSIGGLIAALLLAVGVGALYKTMSTEPEPAKTRADTAYTEKVSSTAAEIAGTSTASRRLQLGVDPVAKAEPAESDRESHVSPAEGSPRVRESAFVSEPLGVSTLAPGRVDERTDLDVPAEPADSPAKLPAKLPAKRHLSAASKPAGRTDDGAASATAAPGETSKTGAPAPGRKPPVGSAQLQPDGDRPIGPYSRERNF